MTAETKLVVQEDEWEFIYYKRGTASSFRTGLYNLYWTADFINQTKLESVFPELWVVRHSIHRSQDIGKICRQGLQSSRKKSR